MKSSFLETVPAGHILKKTFGRWGFIHPVNKPEIRCEDTRGGCVVFYIRYLHLCGWRPVKAKEADRLLEEAKAIYNPCFAVIHNHPMNETRQHLQETGSVIK